MINPTLQNTLLEGWNNYHRGDGANSLLHSVGLSEFQKAALGVFWLFVGEIKTSYTDLLPLFINSLAKYYNT